ncbi:fimbrial biogenesis chaperone [Pseudomonas sp. LF245]
MIAGRGVEAGLIALVLWVSLPAFGGVIISGTRHIYPEKSREISIQVSNEDPKSPRLVQAWLDRGRAPELSDVPFSLAPPVFRIDAGKGQVIRLAYTREPLPGDRESLFWLNVLEVPPKPHDVGTAAEGERNYLRFAFRIRTKVFFRPAQLPGKLDDAIPQLRWSLQRGPQGALLRVDNPSAYHVTFHEVALAMGSRTGATLLAGETGMVAPGDSLTLAVRQASPMVIPADAQVQFKYINDYGAFSTPQRAALRF